MEVASAPVILESLTRAPLSVVMPVFNEADGIEGVVRETAAELLDRLDGAELVLVDDASTDATPAILDRLAAEDDRLKVHHAPRNGGHGPALRRALDESTGDWIFQIDSDGQQLLSEFWKLWERRHDADLVIGKRPIHRNGRHRIVVSAGARYVSRGLGGGDIRDVNCPFKLFRRAVWEDLRDDIPASPMVPSLLIAFGAALRGWRIEQTGVTSLPRAHGRSTVNVPALVRLSTGAVREVVAFRLGLARRRPRSRT
ncbi:MAG: glycosyltransferase family 2 protein [Gaiellaceae bacterium]